MSRALRTPSATAWIALLALFVISCEARASEEQLEWCALNQAKVSRVALELGLMEAGTAFTTWKQSDVNGYNRACIEASTGR